MVKRGALELCQGPAQPRRTQPGEDSGLGLPLVRHSVIRYRPRTVLNVVYVFRYHDSTYQTCS